MDRPICLAPLAAALLLAVTACGDSASDAPPTPAPSVGVPREDTPALLDEESEPIPIAAQTELATLIECEGVPHGISSENTPGSGRADVALTLLASFDLPQAIVSRPGDCLLYVGEQAGMIFAFDPAHPPERGGADPVPVLDLTAEVSAGPEAGLVGLEFSPDGERLYASYTTGAFEEGLGGFRWVVEFQMAGQQPLGESLRQVIVIAQNEPCHNAGGIRFGPDGYLYVSVGDDSCGRDTAFTGQDPTDLKGSLLRIDPTRTVGERGYSVPAGNPFEAGGGALEVWTYGLRNPYLFSFDRLTGDLWLPDVGQTKAEEINYLPMAEGGGAGVNLGWPDVEGQYVFPGRVEPEGHLPPLHSYDHRTDNPAAAGCAVIGGFVYRGAAIPELYGWYVYTDFCDSDVKLLRPGPNGAAETNTLAASVVTPTAVGEGVDGEIYFVSWEDEIGRRKGGGVYALVPVS